MSAFIDASCPRCRKRFGWCGTMSNRPACPKCGHRPPQEELDNDETEIKAFAEMLATAPHRADGDTLRKQRVGAGLTLRQAAARLGITATELSQIERGQVKPPDDVAARMRHDYGTGDVS